MFGTTAALYGEITLKEGRIEQSNFDTYQMLRINEAPTIEVYLIESDAEPGGIGEPGTAYRAGHHQRDLRRVHASANCQSTRNNSKPSKGSCCIIGNLMRNFASLKSSRSDGLVRH